MSEKKPTPIIVARVHRLCPVCGKTSYSHAGIHPQCSMRRADAKRKGLIKRERLLANAEKPAILTNGIVPWEGACPNCNTRQQVATTVCNCGHQFTARAHPPSLEGKRK